MKKTQKEKIKVFIVDDDNMLIDGIAKFFKESTSLEYFDRANDPYECLKKLESKVSSIDIILMDVKFPKVEMDGIELAEEIRARYPGNDPRIAFMTISDRAIVDPSNGFHGLIPKNQGILELMEMLNNIYHKGTVYPPPKVVEDHFIDTLTSRQKEIFCLTLREFKVNSIANKLNITTNTVISHQKVILSKIHQYGIKVDQINHPKIIELARKYKLCDKL